MQTTRPITKPSKQRKRLFQAPAHVRHKLLAAHLSPELRGSHIVKSFPVRTGDTVRIMRGDHKGFEGKISRVDLKSYRIYVEGLTREKVDGTTIFVPVHPSKVIVTHLNLDDKWRKEILETKKEAFKKPKARELPAKPKEKPEEKPPEIVEVEEVVEEKVVEEKVVAEKVVAEKVVAEKVVAEKEAPAEEKAVVKEEPKKRVAKGKRKIVKKKPTVKAETKAKEAAKEKEKPKPEKKRTRRKAAKKTKEGGA